MGVMRFALPPGRSSEQDRALERSCIQGGPDFMPWPSHAQVLGDELIIRRTTNESGALGVLWKVSTWPTWLTSATLVEKNEPYHLLVEVLRGHIHYLRSQAQEYESSEWVFPAEQHEALQELTRQFARLVAREAQPDRLSALLERGLALGDALVERFCWAKWKASAQADSRDLEALAERWGVVVWHPPATPSEEVPRFFHALQIAFDWARICPAPGTYDWELTDALVSWATRRTGPDGLIVAGPLVDCTSRHWPPWFWTLEYDQRRTCLLEFVETVVRRYADRIRVWEVTRGLNWPQGFDLSDADALTLAAQLVAIVRRVHGALEPVLGITQPGGEYLSRGGRILSPLVLVDSLLRYEVPVSAIHLELAVGIEPRSSYRRDSVRLSRLLDLYALLGLPIYVTVAAPAASGPDPLADDDLQADAWQGASQELQSHWLVNTGLVAWGKPYVRAVFVEHWCDAFAHRLPHCGLLDGRQQPRPALRALERLLASGDFPA